MSTDIAMLIVDVLSLACDLSSVEMAEVDQAPQICPTFCKYGQTSLHAVTCDLCVESCPSDHN